MSEKETVFVPKTPLDFQKLKLERLMQNPEKPVVIPETPKEKKLHNPPEFVRNVMGSSAGAGSGEFHVYRHLRRKEYARQKAIDEIAGKDELDIAYHRKIEENKLKMEGKTLKKRLKRLKKKEKMKNKKKTKVAQVTKQEKEKVDHEDEDSDDAEESGNNSRDSGEGSSQENSD